MILCASMLVSTPAKLQGILFGKSVWFDHISVQKFSAPAKASSNGRVDKADVYSLTFQKGDSMMYEEGLKVYVNVKLGAKLDQLSVVHPSVKFGTPEYTKVVHGHSPNVSCGRGALAMFINGDGRNESASDQIKFKFFSKAAGNGHYKASIYAYNTEYKTGVQGNFTFKLEKF